MTKIRGAAAATTKRIWGNESVLAVLCDSQETTTTTTTTPLGSTNGMPRRRMRRIPRPTKFNRVPRRMTKTKMKMGTTIPLLWIRGKKRILVVVDIINDEENPDIDHSTVIRKGIMMILIRTTRMFQDNHPIAHCRPWMIHCCFTMKSVGSRTTCRMVEVSPWPPKMAGRVPRNHHHLNAVHCRNDNHHHSCRFHRNDHPPIVGISVHRWA